jgi:hypothetical protein
MHAGMDLGHPGGRGTPVLAVQKGIVEQVLSDADRSRGGFNGYGNGVIIHHPDDDTWALYAHLDHAMVEPGQQIIAGQQIGAMGNSNNGKFPGMGVHLHLELRKRKSSGASPFPGPYPQSPQNLYDNLDPHDWLAGKGLQFSRRGNFEIQPNSPMASTSSLWANLGSVGLRGVDPYPKHRYLSWRIPETSLAGLGQEADNRYEPPAHFDRDVYFGLTPVEWAAAGSGVLVLTGTVVALVVRRRVKPNRRRGVRRRAGRRTSRVRA